MRWSRLHSHPTVRWIWKHTSAGVALLLILAALIMGYSIGRPSPTAPDVSAGSTVPQSNDPNTEPTMYTCSMHPSVRLPDPNAKCPICFMDLIPVKEIGGVENERRITLDASASRTSRVDTTSVARFFPTAEVRLYGKVAFDETSVARLTAYFPGRIERLFVNYLGIPVAKGDHIAEVYSPELMTAFEEFRQAKIAANTNTSTSELVRSTTNDTLIAAREKLRLFGITEEQLASIETGTLNTQQLTIYAPIGGVVTHLGVREGDYVQTGDPVATVADLSHLWLDMEAYESQLPLLQWGQSVQFTVEAHPGETFTGRISFIEPIVDERTRTAAVRVAVDNTNRKLKPGMFASAVVRMRVAASGAVVSDELAGQWVSPMHPSIVKDAPGTCDICGMDLVPAESLGIVGDPSSTAKPLVVPRSAVLFTGKRSIVYVEIPDTDSPTYEGRQITLGPRAGDFYIVVDGLTEGESVVTHGAFRVDSAMQIVAKPSMMMPAPGSPNAAHAEHSIRGNDTSSVPDEFIYSLKPIYTSYFTLQEQLAADDFSKSLDAIHDLNTALSFVTETGLVGDSRGTWRSIRHMLKVETPPQNIDAARVRFESMSQAIIDLQRQFGHFGSDTWHIAYCPMAFDDKGAEWLQRDSRINNPYFGAFMLRCGEIRDAFPPLTPDTTAPDTHGNPNEGQPHE